MIPLPKLIVVDNPTEEFDDKKPLIASSASSYHSSPRRIAFFSISHT